MSTFLGLLGGPLLVKSEGEERVGEKGGTPVLHYLL